MAKVVFKTMEMKESFLLFLKILKVVSPVSGVGMVSTVFLFLSVVYYGFLVPYQWKSYCFSYFLVNIAISHWILLNTLYNYVLSIIIHPGKSKGVGPSKCRTCRTNRPERSHHCRQCGFCVLMMDHHCMWINNCIGYYNYGYFMRACAFVLIGAMYGTLALWPEVVAYSEGGSAMFGITDIPNICLAAWCLCFATTIGFTILNLWYISLITSGMTSIEYKQLKAWKGAVSPYDRGWKANLSFAYGIKAGKWNRLLLPCYYIPYNYWTEVNLETVHTN